MRGTRRKRWEIGVFWRTSTPHSQQITRTGAMARRGLEFRAVAIGHASLLYLLRALRDSVMKPSCLSCALLSKQYDPWPARGGVWVDASCDRKAHPWLTCIPTGVTRRGNLGTFPGPDMESSAREIPFCCCQRGRPAHPLGRAAETPSATCFGWRSIAPGRAPPFRGSSAARRHKEFSAKARGTAAGTSACGAADTRAMPTVSRSRCTRPPQQR